MRKVAFYATLILTIIGAGALLPSVPIVREAILTKVIAAIPDATVTYDSVSGNAWSGVTFTNAHVEHPQFGTLTIGTLDVSYYLPAVLGGELPLTIAANHVAGDISVTAAPSPTPGATRTPRITPLFRDIAINGVAVTVNGVPFALSALTLEDVHAVQTSSRMLEVRGTVGSEFGSVQAEAHIDLFTGAITGDITEADLGFVRTWWPPLIAGNGHGSFAIANGAIEALLYVNNTELDLLDLGLVDVDGVVNFSYPVLDFDVHTRVLGGSADVTGSVDFEASHYEIDGEAIAPLAGLADWIGRNAAPDGLPVDLGGDLTASLSISGWNTAQVKASGSALGALLGFPLVIDDAEFTYYHDGNMRLDAAANYTGSPLAVTMRPASDGTHLRVSSDSLNFFTEGGTAFSLFSNVHTGYVNTTLGLTLPTAGESLRVSAELDGVPNEYSLYTEASLGAERIGTGAFAVDGLGRVGGQVEVSLPLPGNEPLIATGTLDGSLTEAALTLRTQSPQQIMVPVGGFDIAAIDPRGTVYANVATAGFTDIHGTIGGLHFRDGAFAFATQTGTVHVAGAFTPMLADTMFNVSVHDVQLGFDTGVTAAGLVGLALPMLPSVEQLSLAVAPTGEVEVTSTDGALALQYGPQGLRADGVNVPVVLGGVEFTVSAFVREVAGAYLVEVVLPAGTTLGGASLRHETTLHGTFDPRESSALQLVGTSGTTPLQLETDGTALALTVNDEFTIHAPFADGDVTLQGRADLGMIDDLLCFNTCDAPLGVNGSVTSEATINVGSWRYGGSFTVDLAGVPLAIRGVADASGNLHAELLLDGVTEPLLRVELPAATPPLEALNDVFSGGLAGFSLAGIELPRVPWDVHVDLANGAGIVRLPNGEFVVEAVAGELVAHGDATVPLEAGGVPFSVRVTLAPTAMNDIGTAKLSATLYAADGTVLITAAGTPDDIRGDVELGIPELAALLGQDALAGIHVDGENTVFGAMHIDALAGEMQFSGTLGSITATGGIQNGIPTFSVATEGAEVSLPNAPPITLTGTLTPTEPLNATLSWRNEDVAVTATLDYHDTVITASVPAEHITNTALNHLTGKITVTYDLATNTLSTDGAYRLPIGDDQLTVTLDVPNGDIAQLQAVASFAQYSAHWNFDDPSHVHLIGPDVQITATITDPLTAHGFIFGYDVAATLHLSPTPRIFITSSALPGEIIAEYDATNSLIVAELTGDTPASARLNVATDGVSGTIEVLTETVSAEYDPHAGTILFTHELGTAQLDTATFAWTADFAYEQGEITVHASATGTALTGTLTGTASISGISAALEGDINDTQLTLIARGEEVAGTTVLASLNHDFATPLTAAVFNVQLSGAMTGTGDVRFHDDAFSLRLTVLSDLLPDARVIVNGEFTDELVLSASGEGALHGRVLYQNGALSGSMELQHDVGTVEGFIVNNEAHVTVESPYLPGGSLFTIVPLARVPERISLDGLGTIVGEVVVDLREQRIELINVSAHHDVGTLHVNQIIPFAGPYSITGEVHIPPLERAIPIVAALNDEGLLVAITGASGEAYTVIPTTAGPIDELTVQLNDFALPLAGADGFPVSGEATVSLTGGITLTVQTATTGDTALVGEHGYLPDLAFSITPAGDVVATTAGYTFTLTAHDGHYTVREEQTGGGFDVSITTVDEATTIDVAVHDNLQFLADTTLPFSDANITAQAVIRAGRIHAVLDIATVAFAGFPASLSSVQIAFPETALNEVLNATVDLSGVLNVTGIGTLELIGNASFSAGVPYIDVISSSGQQVSGTVWPLDLNVSSIGALQGAAHITTTGVELDELYLEIDQARVLLDGTIEFGALPTAALLGQIAYRDEASEYPASLFSLTGTDGSYRFSLGEETNGLTADISITPDWEPTARVSITDFVMQLPAFEHTSINGDLVISSGSISGSTNIRIGAGTVRARGSVPFVDFPNLLSGGSAANAEVTIHQVALTEIPFLGIPEAFSGAVNGTMFLRGGTISGQFIVPGMFASPQEIDIFVYGANGVFEATTAMYGSILALELSDGVLAGSLQLEQFPVHDVTEAFTASTVPEIFATGFARLELPLHNPRNMYVRVASEAINISNADGERGTIDISAVLEHERLEVHHFDVTGLGTWHASGVLSNEELDFTLDVQDGVLGGILRFIPALQPFQPELRGSFAASATGSVTEPRIEFSAPQLLAGISGSHYELSNASLFIEPSGITLDATISGSDALDGRLNVSGSGAVGASLFDVQAMELTVEGDLAVPTVGLIDNISGTIAIPANAAPTVDITGYLGNKIELSGTLDPLNVALRGTDIRLALPVLMVQDTRLNPDLRVFMGDSGLSLSGEIHADFLTLDPGLRAKQLQEVEATGVANPLTGLHLAGVRIVVPQRLSFVNSLATIEGAADITATGPLTKLELEGFASAIRGVIRFSGRDFELIETAVTFSRTAGIYPHIRILARTRIDKSRITSGRDDITFAQPTDGQTFDIDLLIAGDVTPAPLEPGGFTFDVSPVLSSNAVLELTSATGGRTTHTFSNDELLTLAVLGRLDLSSSVAGSGSFGSAIAQGVLDSALDVLIVSEIERVLKAELGFDLLELRTSSLSALASQGAEPFGVSLKVGGYLDDGLFATYQISTLDRSQYGPVLMNQVGLQYDVGPVVFDVAARVYSPNDVTLFETVPELGVAVRYDLSEKLSATGAVDLSADRFAVRFGVTLVW